MSLQTEEIILEEEARSMEIKNNSSKNETVVDSYYFYKVEQFTVLWLLFSVIVIGNLSVLYTRVSGRCRKNRMNYFITHLAIADLLVGVINVFTDIVWRITVTWYAGNIGCKIIRFLQVVVTYASTYVLVALSIDRYDAIRHPMKFSGSWKRAKCLIIAAWIFSVLFSIPILILYEEKEIDKRIQCWIELQPQWKWQVYISLVSIKLFFIPAGIIATCYTAIIITIWTKNSKGFTKLKKNATDGRLGSDNSRRASSRGLIPRAKVKTVKITFVIVSAFIICWSPYMIFDLLQVFEYFDKNQTTIAMATFFQSLAPLNSAANPIIYCIFSTRFCRTLSLVPPFKWLCRRKKKIKADSTTNTQTSSLSDHIHLRRSTDASSTKVHAVLLH